MVIYVETLIISIRRVPRDRADRALLLYVSQNVRRNAKKAAIFKIRTFKKRLSIGDIGDEFVGRSENGVFFHTRSCCCVS